MHLYFVSEKQLLIYLIYQHGSKAYGTKLQVSFFLDTKKTPPNTDVCPESLKAVLKY